MYIENNINSDTLKAVTDTLKTVAGEDHTFSNLSFNISNIGMDEAILTVLGYGIVFLALVILYLFFANLAKLISMYRKKKLKSKGKTAQAERDDVSGETAAAISMALSLHFREIHDYENTIITIKKVQSTYSPWNSKLYGLRQYPKH